MSAGWRECADPAELAAAVAAGVEVQVMVPGGVRWALSSHDSAKGFALGIAAGHRYRVPPSWSWSYEPPTPCAACCGGGFVETSAGAVACGCVEPPAPVTGKERAMNESKGWRECDDPAELAAAVAAGVEVQYRVWHQNYYVTADEFAASGLRYRVPSSWSWSPEPPADVPTGAERYLAGRLADPEYRDAYEAAAPDDLVARARRHTGTHPESRDLIEELLDEIAVLHYLGSAPPPVPPWPGAVLSGLVDEDGVPTWLAQAGQVRGEQVRACRRDEWETCEDDPDSDVWVEVRAPRAVPVPETERVSAFDAVLGSRRIRVTGEHVVACNCLRVVDDGEVWVGEFGTGYAVVAPDGTVEVLKDGDR